MKKICKDRCKQEAQNDLVSLLLLKDMKITTQSHDAIEAIVDYALRYKEETNINVYNMCKTLEHYEYNKLKRQVVRFAKAGIIINKTRAGQCYNFELSKKAVDIINSIKLIRERI